MLDNNLLLVDIGGTNIRYAYSNIGDHSFVSENKAELESLNDFDNLISELLANSVVKNIVFSVAGPKLNNSIKMTNRNFEIDADAIKKRFNLESCHLLNDWESIGYSIKTFSENDFDDYQDEEEYTKGMNHKINDSKNSNALANLNPFSNNNQSSNKEKENQEEFILANLFFTLGLDLL